MNYGLLDEYSRRARAAPSLLVLFPLFLAAALSAPELHALGSALWALAVACGLTIALAQFARTVGKRVQNQLVKEWGGMPTSLFLRRDCDRLDDHTKERYLLALEANVPNWTRPSREDEDAYPERATAQYNSAIKWLLEKTRSRDQYPLVFAENVTYGFRRNCLGLKPFGLASVAIAFAILTVQLGHTFIDNTHSLPAAQLVGSAFLLLHGLWWLAVVTKRWVWEAAADYAIALLGAADSLN